MDRKDLIHLLYKNQDIKYKEFHEKITLSNNIIGVRTPILKKIAKEIARTNYLSILEYTNEYYEEKIIFGLVLGYSKISFDELCNLLDIYIEKIDNWALCDIIVSNLKQFKNNEVGYERAKDYINSNNNWKIRFGIVLLLTYYIDNKHIDEIINICKNIKNKDYYVQMANAWLFSIVYIGYKEKIFNIIKDLDDFTKRKTISKIKDSFRVKKEDKNILKELNIN